MQISEVNDVNDPIWAPKALALSLCGIIYCCCTAANGNKNDDLTTITWEQKGPLTRPDGCCPSWPPSPRPPRPPRPRGPRGRRLRRSPPPIWGVCGCFGGVKKKISDFVVCGYTPKHTRSPDACCCGQLLHTHIHIYIIKTRTYLLLRLAGERGDGDAALGGLVAEGVDGAVGPVAHRELEVCDVGGYVGMFLLFYQVRGMRC